MAKRQEKRIGYYPEGMYTRSQRPVKSKWPAYVTLVICASVFITCAVLLINYFSDIAISRDASAQLEGIYNASQADDAASPTPTPTATPSPTPAPTATTQPQQVAVAAPTATPAPLWPSTYPHNPKLNVSSVFDDLQKKNRDIVAWLKIDGVVTEAVVQRDNEYYLTHNVLREKSVTGALFLDENCDLITVPTQTLVHGHNMKEGAMFGSLKRYKVNGASFYREHAYIDFNTLYEDARYVIFAVAEVDIRYGEHNYLPFWQYARFPDESSFTEYVNMARACSMYHCEVDVVPGDRLLTLSTCTGTDDNKRLVVIGRKLRDGENLLDLSMKVMSTVDR